ncbi:MAG: hypothetical protein FD180_12 [Planctomycetota bacterium]|nr:MAG: hypothetical protein FD180_12 [Planctomycetota bacterium]
MNYRETVRIGRTLGARLAGFRALHPLILALPPGGVPIARVLAHCLSGDLDFVQAEAVVADSYRGAVAETGEVVLSSGGDGGERSEELFAGRIVAEMSRMVERRFRHIPEASFPDVTGRVVIVVADGLASGARMRAALTSLRDRGATRLVAAAAAGTDRSVEAVRPLADETICLSIHPSIAGVGRALRGWRHVPEDEAFRMLRKEFRTQESALAYADSSGR